MEKVLKRGKRIFAMLMALLLVLGLVPVSPVEMSAEEATPNTLTINMDKEKGIIEEVADADGNVVKNTDANEDDNVFAYPVQNDKIYYVTFSDNTADDVEEVVYGVFDGNAKLSLENDGKLKIEVTSEKNAFNYDVKFVSDATTLVTTNFKTSEIDNVVFETGVEVEAAVTIDGVTTMKYNVLPKEDVNLIVTPEKKGAKVTTDVGTSEKNGEEASYMVALGSCNTDTVVNLSDNLIDLTVEYPNTVSNVVVYKDENPVTGTNDVYSITKESGCYIEFESELPLKKLVATIGSETGTVVEVQEGTYKIDLGTIPVDATDKIVTISEKEFPKVTLNYPNDKISNIKVTVDGNEVVGSAGTLVFEAEENVTYTVTITPTDPDAVVTAEGYTVNGTTGDRTMEIADISTATNINVSVVDVYTVNFDGNYGTINRLDTNGAVIDSVTDGKLLVREDETNITLQIVPETGKYISKLQLNGTNASFVEGNLNTSDFSYKYDVTVANGDTISVDVATIAAANPVAMDSIVSTSLNDTATDISGVDVYYIRENITLTPVTSGAKLLFAESGFVSSKEISATTTLSGITVLNHTGVFAEGMLQTYTFDKSVRFVVDKTAPTVDGSLSSEFFGPNSLTIKVAGVVSDDTAVDRVVYFTENKDVTGDRDAILSGVNAVTPQDGKYTFTITLDEATNADVSYYVYAIDVAGNIAKVGPITVTYDNTAPVDGSVVITDIASVFDFLYTKNPIIEVEVVGITDAAAGVAEIKVFVYDENDQLVTEGVVGDNNKVLLNNGITNGKAYKFMIIATDKVGNEGVMYQAEIEFDSQNYTQLSYDGTAPLVTVTPVTNSNTDGVHASNANTYYISKAIFDNGYLLTISANDYLEGNTNNPYVSGLAEVSVKINGSTISKDAEGTALVDYSTAKTYIDSFNIDLAQVTSVDGKYVVEVTATDNIGNVSETKTYTICVDETAPAIGDIKVNGTTAQQGQFQSYGFFTNDQFNISIAGVDNSSGVKYYYVEMIEGNKVTSEKEVNYVEGNTSFVVSNSFKGTIRVTTYDNVGNKSSAVTLATGLICEKENTHASNAGVTLTTEETSMKDINGVQLYAENTKVGVVVTDTYAGIYEIKWSVVAPFDTANNTSGSMTSGELASGWKAETTDKGIVTKVSGKIPVSNNSNNIVVKVTVTDNAGNTSTSNVVVSIDKTTPTINVSVAGDDADSQYTSTFNGDRVATIVIRERNFNTADAKVTITNTDGVIPSVTNWVKKEDSSNPDNNTYTATVTFAADGDYTLDVAYTDLAKRAATAPAQQTLTIDKTLPVASVSMDGTALNNHYFASGRTATIVVNEHNFDASRVQLTGTATNNGVAVAIPSIGTWSTNGNTHIATISFSTDADYQLVLTGVDKAGNAFTYEIPTFVIDKVAPTISITGVEDQSANAGDVIPVITLGDINYDTNGVNITLVGANNGTMELDGAFSDTADGQVFTFNNFPNEQSYDDIYTLTATKTDMAGNETTETITFSVNRFGSVYTLSDELKNVVGKYVKEPFQIVLTETNIDRLNPETIKVVLTFNGEPTTLVLGTDYTITESGSDGTWKQYVYTISESVFKGDGSYSLALYSVDAAGNVNENINEVKEAEVIFGIDSTAPIIDAVNFESGFTSETAYLAMVSVVDNIILSSLEVLIDGIAVEVTEDNGVYSFTIPESSSRQTIVITATDSAGNVTTMEYTDILITSNPFLTWMNNTPLFVGSIVGVVAIGGGAGAFVFFRRRNVVKIKK